MTQPKPRPRSTSGGQPRSGWAKGTAHPGPRLGGDLLQQHAAVAQAIAEVEGLARLLDPAPDTELGRACRLARARLTACDPSTATTPAAVRRMRRRLHSICADLLAEIVPS